MLNECTLITCRLKSLLYFYWRDYLNYGPYRFSYLWYDFEMLKFVWNTEFDSFYFVFSMTLFQQEWLWGSMSCFFFFWALTGPTPMRMAFKLVIFCAFKLVGNLIVVELVFCLIFNSFKCLFFTWFFVKPRRSKSTLLALVRIWVSSGLDLLIDLEIGFDWWINRLYRPCNETSNVRDCKSLGLRKIKSGLLDLSSDRPDDPELMGGN